MKLSSVHQKFILHWGEMGTRWGINRTVAQIHALLYISESPLHAEEITETLSVARSNVSTSLRELQAWGIVRVVPVLGDRRTHYESLTDVWDMFRIIMAERKRREIDPTLEVLSECLAEGKKKRAIDAHALERIRALDDFMQTMNGWYEAMSRLPQSQLVKVIKLGDRIGKFLGRG